MLNWGLSRTIIDPTKRRRVEPRPKVNESCERRGDSGFWASSTPRLPFLTHVVLEAGLDTSGNAFPSSKLSVVLYSTISSAMLSAADESTSQPSYMDGLPTPERSQRNSLSPSSDPQIGRISLNKAQWSTEYEKVSFAVLSFQSCFKRPRKFFFLSREFRS